MFFVGIKMKFFRFFMILRQKNDNHLIVKHLNNVDRYIDRYCS